MPGRAASLMLTIIVAPALLALPAMERPALPVQVRSGRPIVDGVYLNGRGPYRFLLDTGAQTNVVDADLAAALGVQPTFRVEVQTSGGQTLAPGARGMEVRLGPARAIGQEFLLTGLEAVRAAAPGVQGVLGQEFLRNFDYLLDLRGRRLAFGNPALTGGIHLPLETAYCRIVVPTNLGRLVLDSGADRLILYEDHASLTGLRFELRTAAGVSSAFDAHPQPLVIDGHPIRHAPAVSIPRPEAAQEDGLLPLSLFDAIYVSRSGRYVTLNPRAR